MGQGLNFTPLINFPYPESDGLFGATPKALFVVFMKTNKTVSQKMILGCIGHLSILMVVGSAPDSRNEVLWAPVEPNNRMYAS